MLTEMRNNFLHMNMENHKFVLQCCLLRIFGLRISFCTNRHQESHVTRLKPLKSICYNIWLDHFTRSDVCPSPKSYARIDCTISTNITILFDGNWATLVATLGALPFLHVSMGHRAKNGDIRSYPSMSTNMDRTVVNEGAILRNHYILANVDVIAVMTSEWCLYDSTLSKWSLWSAWGSTGRRTCKRALGY